MRSPNSITGIIDQKLQPGSLRIVMDCEEVVVIGNFMISHGRDVMIGSASSDLVVSAMVFEGDSDEFNPLCLRMPANIDKCYAIRIVQPRHDSLQGFALAWDLRAMRFQPRSIVTGFR